MGHLRIFFWHLLMNLIKNYLLKKLLKWDNKNVRILIFANVVFKKKTKKKKHQDISFYTCVPKILMIWSSSWYMEHDGLLPLNQPKNLENQNFEEKKKMLEVLIIFKNRPPICDRPPTYICWDKFWSMSSTDKFMILWKSQEKMISIDVSPIYRGYVEIEKNKLKWRLIHGG